MPTYRITDPESGQTIKMTGDSPPTGDQIKTAFSEARARSAGVGATSLQRNTSAPRLDSQGIGDLVTGESRATELTDRLPELMGSGLFEGEDQATLAKITPALLTALDPNEVAKIVESNFKDIGITYNKDGRGDVFPILVNNKTGRVAQVNKPGLSQFDVAQGGATAAAFSGGGRLGLLGTVGKDVAVESGLQAAQEMSGGDFDTADVLLAGGTAATAKSIEGVTSGVSRATRGTPDNQIVKAGNDVGVPVLTSDVLPPETFAGRATQKMGERAPFVGTGPVRARQQQFREQALADTLQQYGVPSFTDIVESLKTSTQKRKTAAGQVLETTGVKLDQVGEIPISNTLASLGAAVKEITRPNVMNDNQVASDLANLIKTLKNPQTFSSLKENRTAFREIVEAVDPTSRSQLPRRAKALVKRVQDGMTKDMDAFARSNLSSSEYSAWVRANKDFADEAADLTRTRLKTVLDKGEATPEIVRNLVFSRNASELALLKKNLTPNGAANVRAAVIQEVVDKASKRKGGVNPGNFAAELRKVQPQIEAFFSGDDKKQMRGLALVLEHTSRAQDAGLSTPTGQDLLAPLFLATSAGEAAATGGVPALTLGVTGTVGFLSQLYESAPVRNALLRLASVPKGSTQFDRALTSYLSAIRAGAQTADPTALDLSEETLAAIP